MNLLASAPGRNALWRLLCYYLLTRMVELAKYISLAASTLQQTDKSHFGQTQALLIYPLGDTVVSGFQRLFALQPAGSVLCCS